MGKPNPFFRFTPAQINGGFEPGLTIQSGLTDDLFSQFTNGDYVGDPYGSAIESINQIIDLFNLPANGGFFRLIYPSPWPVISGSQTLTFYIQSDQLHAVDSLQRITIILSLVNGVVSGSTFSFVGPTTKSSDYANPLIPAEVEIKRALEVYYQNGAAIFPMTYSFDATTGIATSFLAEGSNWILGLETGIIDRDPAINLPFEPIEYYQFSVLLPDEKYVTLAMEMVINYAVKNPTTDRFGISDFADTITIPTGYTYTFTSGVSGDLQRVSLLFAGPKSFLLIGRYDGTKWLFQRFFNPDTNPANNFFTNYAIGVALPYAPLTGRLFPNGWYDYESVQFESNCPDTDENYQLPIKTGDQYQFNIIPDQANLFGLTEVKVGLFDAELNFIQQIGTAVLPDCKINVRYTVVTVESDDFTAFLTILGSNTANFYFDGIDTDGNSLGHLITIPRADYNTSSIAAFAGSIIAAVNAIDGYSASYDLGSALTFFLTVGNVTVNLAQVDVAVYSYQYDGIPKTNICSCATQFQATVNIPAVADGCYCFGLYNADESISELYSISNALVLDNAECFSTMWQFGTSQESIVEGFEYYSGWIQKVRMPINGGGEKPKIEESIYRNSDGTYQRPSNYSDNTLDLHSDYLDIETRNAVFAATRHPILIFENQNIFVSGDLEVATVQDYSRQTSFRKLAQVRFSALIQGFQPENNVCIGC